MVKNYYEKKKEIEDSKSPNKTEELEKLRKETGQGIGIRLEANVGVPLAIEFKNLRMP